MSINAFSRLKKMGFNPRNIFDVGAHEGTWTEEMKHIFPDSNFYLFEADTDKKSHLSKYNHNYIEVLSSSDDNIIDFYKIIGPFTTGNSIFKELSHAYDEGKFYIEKRTTKTLHTLMINNNLPTPNLLKLDTQGSEIEIIKGMKEKIHDVEIVYLEVSLHQYNQSSPLFIDVINEMNKLDFVLCDIGDPHIINDVMAQLDVFFCKKSSPYYKNNFF